MAEPAPSVEDRLAAYLEAEEAPVEEPKAEAPAEEPEEPQAEEPQVEEEPEAKAEGPESEDEEVIEISSLTELAENDGLSMEDIYSLSIPVNLEDGTAQEIKLGELKDTFHKARKAEAEMSRFNEQKATFEQEVAQQRTSLSQLYEVTKATLEHATKQVTGEVSEARLQELRETDPAEYAAVKADHKERVAALERLKSEMAREFSAEADKQAEIANARRQQMLYQAHQALPSFIPEWGDPKVAEAEKPQLIKYGLSQQFKEIELANMNDPRALTVLRKAWLYDKQQVASPETKKRKLTVRGRVIAPGKTKSKAEKKQGSKTADFQAFRKRGGNVDDAADLIFKHLLDED